MSGKRVVFTFGRYQPPTRGHSKLFKTLQLEARRRRADAIVFISPTNDHVKNPLTWGQRRQFIEAMFPGLTVGTECRSPLTALDALAKLGYTDVIQLVGSDRVFEMQRMLANYQKNVEHPFETMTVISPDLEREALPISGSQMRLWAGLGDFDSFVKWLPTKNPGLHRKIWDAVREGIK